MPDVVLTTLNARYAHASFGLRYLKANLPGSLDGRTAMLEFDISQRPVDIVEAILADNPKIVGIGVYIWNAAESLRVVADLKRVRPDLIVVLGGPEVSYETDQQEIVALADYVVSGEADLAFGELCEKLLHGRRPIQKIIPAELPEFSVDRKSQIENRQSLQLPYDLYTDRDLAHRVVYVEASRGCPFKCEFCLSSLDVPVRNVPLDAFLDAMQKLLDRGLRHFKFVDRTFNLNLNFSRSILQFFLDRWTDGLFLHFEMIPDRLPEALRALIAQFPPGALQFEVGIQTFNEAVSDRISRRQDNAKLTDNLRFLRDHTGVHVHADLIVGLPGETIESFGEGFDRLVALGPQEIQVGMLKRLRGTPIVRHDAEFEMVYSPHPPYEVLQTRDLSFATVQRMRRFSRYWDLIANSGNFLQTTPLIWSGDVPAAGVGGSPFRAFMELSDWLHATTGRTHGIALQDLAKSLHTYLTTVRMQSADAVSQAIWRDYQRGGRSDLPAFLRPYISTPADTRVVRKPGAASSSTVPPRQARRLGA